MHVIIENLTNRPVILTLTSGQTLRLAPAEISPTLPEVEVKNNPKVQKLQENRIIQLQTIGQDADAGETEHPQLGAANPSTEHPEPETETSSTPKTKKAK